MGYAPGFQNDLFVSYARKDDMPLSGAETGWVTTMAKDVHMMVNRLVGGDGTHLYMDHRLAKHEKVGPELQTQLESTALLMVVMSKAYLRSEWCQWEPGIFAKAANQTATSGSRIFIVEIEPVTQEERPVALRDLVGYRFWQQELEDLAPKILGWPAPDPRIDRDYYKMVAGVAREMYRELEEMGEEAAAAKKVTVPANGSNGKSKPQNGNKPQGDADTGTMTVYLAETTDDLLDKRRDVRTYLEQYGFHIVPDRLLPVDGEAFQTQVRNHLEESHLVIQLLSTIAGRGDETSGKTFSRLQFELACELEKPVMKWRAPELTDAELEIRVESGEHLALMQGPEVHAMPFQSFKGEIKAVIDKLKLHREREARKVTFPDMAEMPPLVFVNADVGDQALADKVSAMVQDRGFALVRRLHEGSPQELRLELEQNLLDCDGMLVIYGKTNGRWVGHQMRQVYRCFPQRAKALRALAVGMHPPPPPPKSPIGVMLPNTRILEGLEEAKLDEFLNDLQLAT